jgi:hypothetical protein
MEAGLRWAKRRATEGWWTGLAGLRKLRGSWRPGGRDNGPETDFVCWAESSHGPKMGKGKGKKRKKASFYFQRIFS